MRMDMNNRRQEGFTLIELLIVIGIIGTLAAVLLPRILETDSVAKQAETEATMLQLFHACNRFNQAEGYYPSDDFRYLRKGAGPALKGDNGHNSGIESFLAMVTLTRKSGTDLSALGDKLINTDGDRQGAPMPLLDGNSSRMEVADGWRTPLAYFSKINMRKTQTMVLAPGEDPVQVKAKQRPDGSYYGGRKFQFLSAGQDLTFGTDDDIVWPSN